MSHGRDLLSKGLLKRIGNGQDTHVWYDNWLLLPTPRPPRYRTEEVDLSLMVSDLIDVHRRAWDSVRVRHLFVEEDANCILGIKLNLQQSDTFIWGFNRHGTYDSQSGYRLLDLLHSLQEPVAAGLPPIEKKLWSNLWKVKTMPKIRHFMWRALAGALAVAERLSSRGIQVDNTCKRCQAQTESICHVLFQCPVAKEVWRLSGFPPPQNGFYRNSVFLNFHYLIETCKRSQPGDTSSLIFPWILWHLWKSRNRCIFEQVVSSAEEIWQKIRLEAEAWSMANSLEREDEDTGSGLSSLLRWQKPCASFIKCNIGSSWIEEGQNCGAAWLARNHDGQTLTHSRRSYSRIGSRIEAELLSFHWTVTSLASMRYNNVVFESSSYIAGEAILKPECFPQFDVLLADIRRSLACFRLWSIAFTHKEANRCVEAIATSVTRDHHYSSYIANDGPSWLLPMLQAEAVES